MPDDAITNAQKRRDELAAKINAAQQQIEDWRRDLRRTELFISDWHAFAAGKEPDIVTTAVGAAAGAGAAGAVSVTIEAPSGAATYTFSGSGSGRAVRRYNSPKEDVAAVARRLILEHGEPMSRTDLYRELIVQGLKIDGKVPEMVLSTMLWRAGPSSGIVRLKSGGYSLIEWVATDPGQTVVEEETADSSEA